MWVTGVRHACVLQGSNSPTGTRTPEATSRHSRAAHLVDRVHRMSVSWVAESPLRQLLCCSINSSGKKALGRMELFLLYGGKYTTKDNGDDEGVHDVEIMMKNICI